MPNYFDTMLEDVIFGRRYPRGTQETYLDEEGAEKKRAIAPQELGMNEKKKARMEASERESNMLNYQMKSKRKLKEGEKMPSGAYALAQYPGLANTVDAAISGLLPGSLNYSYFKMTPEQQRDLLAKQKAWGIEQKRLLGL